MTSSNQKPTIDFSNAKEPPRTIDRNSPEAQPIEASEVSKDDKSSDDVLKNQDDKTLGDSQIISANISGS